MSRSRFGGFFFGRRLFNKWNELKSPSAPATAPTNVHDLAYTDAQGIWNLRSTTQFPKSNSAGGSSGGSSGGTITQAPVATSYNRNGNCPIPVGSAVGDFAIGLFSSDDSGSISASGWTPILNESSGGVNNCRLVIAWKILTSSDIGSSAVISTTANDYIGAIYTWANNGATPTFSAITSQSTTGTASSQTITGNTSSALHIAVKAAARESNNVTINGMTGQFTEQKVYGSPFPAVRLSALLATSGASTTVTTVDDGYGQVFASFWVTF